MSKKVWAILFLIFLIMFGLNYLMPLCYGDDYVYAFIWSGQPMYTPLPETVVRISGFNDILVSQWKHYLTWGGRVPAHLLVQFFIWQDKQFFNFLNSAVFVLLLLEIYWISNRGEITFKRINMATLCWIFFFVWAFTVNFAGVFLWLTGSCNYLWMMVILLSFLTFYIRKYYHMEEKFFESGFKKLLLFLWGFLAGWTNENTVCWVILVLGLWLLKNRKQKDVETWMWCGLIGLCTGYMFLVFAPGNMIRADYYDSTSINIWSWSNMHSKLITFVVLEYLQIFLWFYIFTAWRKIKKVKINERYSKHFTLVQTFCAFSLLSNCIMLLTPEFHARSGFFSLVFLTIAVTLLISNQADFNVSFIDNYTKKIIMTVSVVFFLITLCGTYAGMYSTYQYNQSVIMAVQKHRGSGFTSVLEIPAPKDYPEALVWASGRHIVQLSLKEDEHEWKNVAFARYYRIKGIRINKSLK